MPLGISFIPPNQQQQDQQQQPTEPLQQAVQILQLRVPRFGGVNAIAPDPLLQRQPGQPLPPQPGTPEWEELMRRLREGQQGMSPQPGWAPQPGGPPPPSTPPPKVTPGIKAPGDAGPIAAPPSKPTVPGFKPIIQQPNAVNQMLNHLGTRPY